MSLIRFNFQNNHGNANSGEPYHNPQSGQQNRTDTIFRGSHRSCSIKKSVLKNFTKFTGKHLCRSLFLNKVRPATLLKKRLRQRCFAVNLMKFLRTPVL